MIYLTPLPSNGILDSISEGKYTNITINIYKTITYILNYFNNTPAKMIIS